MIDTPKSTNIVYIRFILLQVFCINFCKIRSKYWVKADGLVKMILLFFLFVSSCKQVLIISFGYKMLVINQNWL